MEEGDHHQYICCSFWGTPAAIMPQMPAHSILTQTYPSQKNSSSKGFTNIIVLFVIQKWQLIAWQRPRGVKKWQQSVKFPLLGRRIWRFGKKRGGVMRGRRKKKHSPRIQSFFYKVRNRTAIGISPTKQ